MAAEHGWSLEILESFPGDPGLRKTKITSSVHVYEDEEEANLVFLAPLDLKRAQGLPYNLNRRTLSVKLTEKKDGCVAREWTSSSFCITRDSAFTEMLVGVLDGFEDEQEELVDALSKPDIRCVVVEPFLTVCTHPWQKNYFSTHGAALSMRIPLSAFVVHDQKSPEIEKKREVSLYSIRPRPPRSERRETMPEARKYAREASRAVSRDVFEKKREAAVAVAARRVQALKRELEDAEQDLRSFKRMRYRSDPPPTRAKQPLKVSFRGHGNDFRRHVY